MLTTILVSLFGVSITGYGLFRAVMEEALRRSGIHPTTGDDTALIFIAGVLITVVPWMVS